MFTFKVSLSSAKPTQQLTQYPWFKALVMAVISDWCCKVDMIGHLHCVCLCQLVESRTVGCSDTAHMCVDCVLIVSI